MNKKANRKASKQAGLSFEQIILTYSLALSLPALGLAAILLWMRESSINVWLSVFLPVVLATVWLVFALRKKIIFPLYTLSNLLDALHEGDFSLRGSRARRGDAMGEVVWELNQLANTLRDQRLRVEETLALLSKVMDNIAIAIFAFDEHSQLRLLNPAAARLLAVTQADALGQSAQDLGVEKLLELPAISTLRWNFAAAIGTWEVRRATFRQGGVPHELIAVADLSRALREEERLAWQRLIRVLGHEINNSLTPIKSMAETLASMAEKKNPAEDWQEDLQSGLRVIGDRAQSLNRFIASYTVLARLPQPQKQPVALEPVLRRVAKLIDDFPVLVFCVAELEISADADQLEQALINLLKNAAEACARGGSQILLSLKTQANGVQIEVQDDGPGLASSENLFVPFFTTKQGGSGIGLVLARQIAEAHGGSLSLQNVAHGKGCIASVFLPFA